MKNAISPNTNNNSAWLIYVYVIDPVKSAMRAQITPSYIFSLVSLAVIVVRILFLRIAEESLLNSTLIVNILLPVHVNSQVMIVQGGKISDSFFSSYG